MKQNDLYFKLTDI